MRFFQMSDAGLKITFDYFRNLGIITTLFIGAAWAFKQPSWGVVNHLTALILLLMAAYLFIVNLVHFGGKAKSGNIPPTLFVAHSASLAVLLPFLFSKTF